MTTDTPATTPDDVERCLACDKPMRPGDRYLPDISGGVIHYDALGPEPETYVDLDTGAPLAQKPEPLVWCAPHAAPVLTAEMVDELARLRGADDALRPHYAAQGGFALAMFDAAPLLIAAARVTL